MFSISVYVAAISAANLLVAKFGPVVTPFNAFFLIGLDMAIRNSKHEKWENDKLPWRMGGLISASGIVSYAINPASGVIALASLVAFSASVAVDTIVYQALIKKPWAVKVNGSNGAAALADSMIFPMIAFGAFMPEVVTAQFAAKLAGGAMWSYLIMKTKSICNSHQ